MKLYLHFENAAAFCIQERDGFIDIHLVSNAFLTNPDGVTHSKENIQHSQTHAHTHELNQFS